MAVDFKVEKYFEAHYKALEKLQELDYDTIYLVLYGSQNYNLDLYLPNYKSDFDFKAVIIPSYLDILRGKSFVSKVVEYEYGQIDVKDIRLWSEQVLKGNPVYLEGLFSKYYWKEDFDFIWLRDLGESLVKEVTPHHVNAVFGMIKQKEKALCHPYPSIEHKIKKDGYDGKQSSHILRLSILLQNFYNRGLSYSDSLINRTSMEAEMLQKHKLNELSLHEVEAAVALELKFIEKFKESWKNQFQREQTNKVASEKFQNLVFGMLEKRIEKQVFKNYNIPEEYYVL